MIAAGCGICARRLMMGLFARSIADIAVLRSVLTGLKPGAPVNNLRDVRIGVCRTPSWDQAQPETVSALETAARKLAAAGAKLHDAEMPAVFDGINQSFNVISGVEALRAMALEARDHLATINHWIKDSLTAAAQYDQSRYDKAQLHAVQCQRATIEMFTRCDILITPSTAGEAIARCLGIQLRFQSRLDADARAVRHHSDVRGSKWHAGRIAGGWSGGERRPYDRIVAGRGRCSHVRWFNGALLPYLLAFLPTPGRRTSLLGKRQSDRARRRVP